MGKLLRLGWVTTLHYNTLHLVTTISKNKNTTNRNIKLLRRKRSRQLDVSDRWRVSPAKQKSERGKKEKKVGEKGKRKEEYYIS